MQENITFNMKAHWDKIYQTKLPNELSWYQEEPTISLEIIKKLNLPKSARIFDNGGGDSTLIDNLLDLGFQNITVQDISEFALERSKKRLGDKAAKIEWIVGSEASCNALDKFDLWHDRATFHFLTEDKEIANYIHTLENCIKPDGYLILATFSEEGPDKCSGLPIKKYSEESINNLLKDSFERIKCFKADHHTPFNTTQNFIFCFFKRKPLV